MAFEINQFREEIVRHKPSPRSYWAYYMQNYCSCLTSLFHSNSFTNVCILFKFFLTFNKYSLMFPIAHLHTHHAPLTNYNSYKSPKMEPTYRYNPSDTTYVVWVSFIYEWRDLQFKVDFKWQIFEKLFMAEFLPQICWEKVAEEIFFHISFCWRSKHVIWIAASIN